MVNTKNKRFFKAAAALITLSALIYLAYLVVTTLYPLKYIDVIRKYSDEFGLDPVLVCAVIHSESRFESSAESYKGAGGLMQLVRMTADWGAEILEIPEYSYDRINEPELNIRLGCWYLSRLFDQYGNMDTALAAYNAGSGNVSRWLQDPKYSKDGITLDAVPYGETRRYIERVRKREKIYSVILDLSNK